MSRTKTFFVDVEKLSSREDQASTIIRLMMACNDISVANHCLSLFKKRFLNEEPSISKHFDRGASMYFIRLQCGHLHEALEVIGEINNDDYFSNKVNECSDIAKSAFKKLTNSLEDGPDRKKFEQYITRIRNNLTFHYSAKNNQKLIKNALSDRASRPEARLSKITLGDEMSLWRFELADDIIDSIVCRQVFKIPRGANLREEVDEISDFGSDLCESLLHFGHEFISRYLRGFATK